jgi:O-antigen ligase
MPVASSQLSVWAFNRKRMIQAADWLAVLLAASLPLSTTATSILVVLWLLAFLPTVDLRELRQVLALPAGVLPVALWALAVAGMLWADAPPAERLEGLGPFWKLLLIPLLFVHFRRSERGVTVLIGFLVGCGALLILSWVHLVLPGLPGFKHTTPGVPFKDYISQSAMLAIAMVIAADRAIDAWLAAKHKQALAWLLFAVVSLSNILFLATSRTALVVIPALLSLLGFRRFGLKGGLALLAAIAVLMAAAWPASSFLRTRVSTFSQEIEIYRSEGGRTSAGERLEFWKKSLSFIAAAPLMGHGTGSIRGLFLNAVDVRTPVGAIVADNPHNQTLAVGIQLGLMGIALLFSLWVSHLLLFRGDGLAAWIGLAIVTQNIVSSLFNTSLFDFTSGWGYVIGMGVAGGVQLAYRQRHV